MSTQRITYGVLRSLVYKWRAALVAHGVKKGDQVASLLVLIKHVTC